MKFTEETFKSCQSQGLSIECPMSTDKIGVGFGCRLHALAGSGSGTLQYFFGREVFLVGSNCPNVSEWIL